MANEFRCSRLNGVVYTPADVAGEVVRIGVEAASSEAIRVLEPSAGDGAFLRALLENGVIQGWITAVDIDDGATAALQENFGEVNIVNADFIEFSLRPDANRYNLIVGNPPFIKRVAYAKAFGDNVKELAGRSGFPSSEMKNAWAAFVVAAAHLLEVNGVLAFVLPYELITVKYGRAVQLFLVENGFAVEIFVSDKKAFPELEQDAVILLAQRKESTPGEIKVHRVHECNQLNIARTATVDILHERRASIDVKSVLLDCDTIDLLHRLRKETPTIVDYCGSAPGIVTAANEFFILRDGEVERRGLTPWARRILKKGSYLPKSPVFGEADLAHISQTEPCNLIDFFGEGSPTLTSAATKYIAECEEEGLHKRYKCQRRKPWYRIPIVEAGDGFFFKRAHILPRLCVNEARVLATDTAYHIRMKDGFSVQGLCFSFYNSLTLLFAEIEGRFYGGGVLELTPEEFRGLPLAMLSPSEAEFGDFVEQMFAATADPETTVGFCDGQVRRKMGISEEQMRGVRSALRSLRVHRMRHAVGPRH